MITLTSRYEPSVFSGNGFRGGNGGFQNFIATMSLQNTSAVLRYPGYDVHRRINRLIVWRIFFSAEAELLLI